jgi:hypothetical protein
MSIGRDVLYRGLPLNRETGEEPGEDNSGTNALIGWY